MVLDDLRGRCPVHHETVSDSVVLSRYADVRPLISDRSLWRDPLKADRDSPMHRRFADALPLGAVRSETTSILQLDDPDHARVRQPLTQAFYARVAKARPQIERLVDETLERLDTTGPFDLMRDYCVPIPIDAIAAILGVDPERLTEFRDWSEGVIQGLNPFRTADQTVHMERASLALSAYFTEALTARREDPRDDLISDMAKLQREGAPLTDIEVRINLTALLVGGNLTTTDLIGNGVRLLMLHPSELAKLRAEPGLISAMVEETLRFDPPVESTSRVVSRDQEVGGCPLKTAQSLLFQLRAANHDPEAFDEPHRFDISRKGKPHVTFGGGAHICIGAPLARLEAQIAIGKLMARFPKLRLADPDQAPEWRKMPFFRGLVRLELRAD